MLVFDKRVKSEYAEKTIRGSVGNPKKSSSIYITMLGAEMD